MKSTHPPQPSRTGLLAILLAYTLWGILPLYWNVLHDIPSWEIISHRILWSLLFTATLLIPQKRYRSLWHALKNRRTRLSTFVTAALLGSNWLVFIWAINSGHIVETSLGYFINPLVSVLLGVLFLKEKLRISQWLPIGLALAGVLYLTFSYGQFPWIGLTLAGTFALYGLLRKTAALPAIEGLFCEMAWLSIPAGLTLAYLATQESSGFTTHGTQITLFLIGTGAVTSIPLLVFVFAAKRIPLTLVGLTQYIAPTLQLLIGLYIFHESFPPAKLIGFSIIWVALILYSIEGIRAHLHRKKLKPV